MWSIVVAVLLAGGLAFYVWFIGHGAARVQPLTGPVTETGDDAHADNTMITAAQALAGAELASSGPASAAPLAAVANLGDISNADQRRSVCGYLTAELNRLDYEFRQPLPPPVVDRIATEVAQLRGQVNRYDCAAGIPGPEGMTGNALIAPRPREPASNSVTPLPPPEEAPPQSADD